MFEEGQACALLLGAELEQRERQLSELSADPASSLADMATSLRRMNELRPDLEELHALLAELGGRAREARVSWLSHG